MKEDEKDDISLRYMNYKVLLFNFLVAVCLVGALSGLSSCRTVKYSELSPIGAIPTLLPPLDATIDVRSLERVFGATFTQGYVSDFGFYGGITYSNPLVQDIITLYQRDMRNIAEEYGQIRGTAVCRLVDGEVGAGGFGWTLLSGMTLFIPNLAGMPLVYVKAAMQLEMSVFDLEGALVGRYTSDYHEERVPVALYHGYGGDAVLKVAIDSYKSCMADIRNLVELDFNRIISALGKEAGARSVSEEGAAGSAEPVLRNEW